MNGQEKRENVINGLEEVREFIAATKNMFEIGFPNIVSDIYDNALDVIYDTLALLKVQEQKCRECGEATSKAIQELQTKLKAQEPSAVHVTAEINYRKIGNCPNCGKPINSGDYPNYCGHCGQAVKW